MEYLKELLKSFFIGTGCVLAGLTVIGTLGWILYHAPMWLLGGVAFVVFATALGAIMRSTWDE